MVHCVWHCGLASLARRVPLQTLTSSVHVCSSAQYAPAITHEDASIRKHLSWANEEAAALGRALCTAVGGTPTQFWPHYNGITADVVARISVCQQLQPPITTPSTKARQQQQQHTNTPSKQLPACALNDIVVFAQSRNSLRVPTAT